MFFVKSKISVLMKINISHTFLYLILLYRKLLRHIGVYMIRNVLNRRRECGTYLATARRQRRRLKMLKRDV
jgi:hypothetical protein